MWGKGNRGRELTTKCPSSSRRNRGRRYRGGLARGGGAHRCLRARRLPGRGKKRREIPSSPRAGAARGGGSTGGGRSVERLGIGNEVAWEVRRETGSGVGPFIGGGEVGGCRHGWHRNLPLGVNGDRDARGAVGEAAQGRLYGGRRDGGRRWRARTTLRVEGVAAQAARPRLCRLSSARELCLVVSGDGMAQRARRLGGTVLARRERRGAASSGASLWTKLRLLLCVP